MVVADTAVDMGAVAGKAAPDMVADKVASGKAVALDMGADGPERLAAGCCCSSWSGGLGCLVNLGWLRYRAAEA